MVHVAREQEWLAPTPGGTRGFGAGGWSVDIVDSSPSVGFTADADAFAVHDCVKRLSSVKASMPADCVGTFDDRVFVRSVAPDVARMITIERSKLVMGTAIDGKRPDWVPSPELKVEKGPLMYDRDRKGRVRYDAAGRPRVMTQLVRFVGDMPWDVARARLLYQVWVAALGWLRAELEGGLERHQVTELMPEAKPWA
jgi:hypothetical protein